MRLFLIISIDINRLSCYYNNVERNKQKRYQTMETKALIKGLKRAKRAMKVAKSQQCFYTNNFLLRVKDGSLFIYGTNSHMLSKEQIDDSEYIADFDTLLSLVDADKLIKDGLTKHGTNVVVTADEMRFDDGLTVSLNSAQIKHYPMNLENVIPQRKDATYEFSIKVKDLKDALKQLKPLTTYVQIQDPTSDLDELEKRKPQLTKDTSHLLELHFSREGKVTLRSHYAKEAPRQIAEATALRQSSSDDLKVIVNQSYLEKALIGLPSGSTINVLVLSTLRPLVIQSEDAKHLYVVCPVRTF